MAIQPRDIVILGSAHPLRGGGISTFNERMAKAFMDAGFNTSIYSFSLQYPGFLFPGTSQFTDDPAPAGLDIHTRVNSINPFNWISVGNELKKRRPDLLIVRYWLPFMAPCLGTILRIVRSNKHTRIVCIADNVVPHEARAFDKIFTRYFVKPVHAFITMSDKVFRDLRQFEPSKPAIQIPHPLYDNFGEAIDQASAQAYIDIRPKGPLLLFFGFIRKYKGVDLLLEALHLVVQDEQYKDLQLLIAGEFYDDEKPYLQQIESLGLKEHVILRTQFIADKDVRYYLCAADVVVQPYRNATQSGVTPLAYHFEKPMIVTNVGGLPSLVPDGKVGLVAEPTAESIAEKIREFLAIGAAHFLPALRQEKKKYSWENFVRSVLDIA